MATRKKTNSKPGRGGKIALGVFIALLLTLLAIGGIGLVNASLLRLRRAEVVLENLPERFDGTTLLYASDIDLCGLNTPKRAGAVFSQLQSLRPDMLILGGDYNSASVLERLNQPDWKGPDEAKAIESRTDFFYYTRDFEAPLGKYAIATTDDPQWQNLKQVLMESGIQPLFNEMKAIRAGDDTLWLVGISGGVNNLNDMGSAFSRDDCVVVIAESPDALPVLLTSEAADSGQWADLVLCGGTHGGQIRLFGRSLLSLSEAWRRFLSGWNTQSGVPILTSEGMGCEGINLRLGTAPEVWLITLRRG